MEISGNHAADAYGYSFVKDVTAMHMDFETVTTLQCRNRSLKKQVEDFQSGEKYIQMEAAYKELLRFHNRKIKRLEYELFRAHSETVTVRRYWGEVLDDMEKEYRKQIRRLEAEIERLKKQNLALARQRDEAKDKLRERTGQYYAAASELEEERGKNKKLTAQVNRDFENSSLPSSLQAAGRKKIPNSREKTGRRPGTRDTLLEDYVGTVVHDHDKTFYSYGTGHQECIQHDICYLTGSIQNEPGLPWNGQMLSLFREMLHYRNGLPQGGQTDPRVVSEFEGAYDRILKKAEEEYTDEPPDDYYREEYNLFVRLREYKEHELLFLHDTRVPANNFLCERLARVYKRKQKQAVTLCSYENLCCICDGLSVVYLLRSKGKNVYQKISEIYGQKRPPRAKEEAGAKA